MNIRFYAWLAQQIAEKNKAKQKKEAMDKTGFCMCEYDGETCYDCPTEQECLDMITKGKTNAQDLCNM